LPFPPQPAARRPTSAQTHTALNAPFIGSPSVVGDTEWSTGAGSDRFRGAVRLTSRVAEPRTRGRRGGRTYL
jgi:hypothetical protein